MAHVSTEIRSEQFIEAAVRVIAEEGVARATTRRIAEAAGAPLASLHYCFRNKDGLFLAVFEHLAEEATGTFDSIEPAKLEVTARRVMAYTADWVTEHADYALAQLDLYLWMVRHRPALATKSYQVYFGAVAEVLQRAAGPSVPVEQVHPLATLLVGATDGLIVQWAAYRDRARVDAYVDAVGAAIPALCARIRRSGHVAGAS